MSRVGSERNNKIEEINKPKQTEDHNDSTYNVR